MNTLEHRRYKSGVGLRRKPDQQVESIVFRHGPIIIFGKQEQALPEVFREFDRKAIHEEYASIAVRFEPISGCENQ